MLADRVLFFIALCPVETGDAYHPKGFILGLVIYNTIISNLDCETECTPGKFGGAIDPTEEKDAIQRDLEKSEATLNDKWSTR